MSLVRIPAYHFLFDFVIMENGASALMIDDGSGTIKAGFVGDDNPRTIFPTVVYQASPLAVMNGAAQPEPFVDNIPHIWQEYSIRHPIEHDIITNWEDMGMVWKHTFDVSCSNS
jgi:actin beta/gamma 1